MWVSKNNVDEVDQDEEIANKVNVVDAQNAV